MEGIVLPTENVGARSRQFTTSDLIFASNTGKSSFFFVILLDSEIIKKTNPGEQLYLGRSESLETIFSLMS